MIDYVTIYVIYVIYVTIVGVGGGCWKKDGEGGWS